MLLSENQEVLKEVRGKEVLYVKHVIKESMRLYPVAPFLTRILPKDCFLGPYKLKKEVSTNVLELSHSDYNF